MKRREFFRALAWMPAVPIAGLVGSLPAEAKGDGISIDGNSLYLGGQNVLTIEKNGAISLGYGNVKIMPPNSDCVIRIDAPKYADD